MHKTLWLLLLLLLPVQAEDSAIPEADQQKPIFLWEAHNETGTVYLFGTIHLPDPRVLVLPRVVQEAFDRSDAVLTEIDMNGAAQAKAVQLMMLPKGEKLTTILPEELLKRLSAHVPVAAVDGMKVWAASMTVMMLQARELLLNGRQPLDLMLPLLGRKAEKQVGALEVVEEQIGIFDQMTTEEQIEMLRKVLDRIDEDKAAGKNSIHAMLDLYLEGDLDGIMKFEAVVGEEPTEQDKMFMKLILDDRNIHMADRLAEKMKKDPGKVWFVAVGAAHYAGDIGVGSLLAKKGFKVRRMTRADTVAPKTAVKKPAKVTDPQPVGAK